MGLPLQRLARALLIPLAIQYSTHRAQRLTQSAAKDKNAITGYNPATHSSGFLGGFSVAFALIVEVGTILRYPTHYSGNCSVAAI
jgi:hypothetical protein